MFACLKDTLLIIPTDLVAIKTLLFFFTKYFQADDF